MSSEAQKMEGRTLDCLRDYLSKLTWKAKGCEEERKPIMDFTGASAATVRRWYIGSTEPIGLQLIKTRYFLESQGYRQVELESLQEPVRNFSRLVAFDVVDIEEAAERIGFTEVSQLFAVLSSKRGLSDGRMETIVQICRENEKKLSALSDLQAMLQNVAVPVIPPITQFTQQAMGVDEEVLRLLTTLDGLVTLLGPRLEQMLSDGFTAEGRQAFREKASEKLIFDLANRFWGLNQQLNALCSEKARELNSNKKKKA